jgi:hypothetical protein
MGKRQACHILETVWSETCSPDASGESSMTASVEMTGNGTPPPCQRASSHKGRRGQSAGGHAALFPMDLAEALESLSSAANGDPDQLFLLPDRVLTMDSMTFREDVASVAPCFITANRTANNNNGCEQTSVSSKLLRVLDDTEGLILSRASNGYLWLCKSSSIPCKIIQKSLHQSLPP